MAIGTNIDYTKREIISFEPDGREATKSVTLNTGEVFEQQPVLENSKTATATQNGEVTVTPTTGKVAMKEVKVTVNVNLKAYKEGAEEDPRVIYAFQDTPTKALTGAFAKVNVTYESETDTILYDESTFARYEDGDVVLS